MIVRVRRHRPAPALLSFDDHGAGEPLVLVHGLATTRSIWRAVAPSLARRRRVIALDVPGFGASPSVGRGFDLDQVAEAMADDLARAGVPEPYEIVGHSMGGALVLALARSRPEAVRAVVLVSPAGLLPLPPVVAGAAGAAVAGLVAVRRVAAPIAVNPWGRRLLMAGGAVDGARFSVAEVRTMVDASRGATRVREALAAVARADLRDVVAGLPQPVALLRGARDPVVPARVVRALAARRPELAVTTIADAGHIPMMERPEAFVRALVASLDDLP